LVRRISEVEELFPALYSIGEYKNQLPMELKGWVNILDLHVQLKYTQLITTSIETLVAGGKYVGYFAATCDYLPDRGEAETMVNTMFGDFSNWKIKKFDQQVWEKRFAHLVEPTAEIAWYLAVPDKTNPMRIYGDSEDIEKYKRLLLPKLDNAVKHFQATGEWIGLHNHKCMNCGKDISWWAYFHCEPCPHCSGKVRE
jgi:hypothetical protein